MLMSLNSLNVGLDIYGKENHGEMKNWKEM